MRRLRVNQQEKNSIGGQIKSMKSKFRSMGRVSMALVLALSLSLVMAVPVSAAETGTVSLDAEWYTLPGTVTVTLTDADLNTVGEAPVGGEILGTGDGSTKTFGVGNSPIASVDWVMDLQADAILTIYGINYDTGVITLAAEPEQVFEERFELLDIVGDVLDGGLDTPIVAATELLITATESTTIPEDATGTLTLTGTSIDPLTLVETADTEDIVITLAANDVLTYETAKYWTAIDADGIDITWGSGEFDLKIEETHTIAAEYSYHQNDGPQTVIVESQTLGPGSTSEVDLTEADVTTGVFTGTFTIDLGGEVADLTVVNGDTIIVTYEDAAPVQSVTDTAQVDATLPVASNEIPEDATDTNDTTPTVAVDIVDLASGIAVVDEVPEITMTFGVTGSPASVTPTLTEVTGGYHVEYQVPGASPLAEAEYTAEVVATDVAGNELTFSWSFTVDATEPSLDSAIADTTTTVVATFSDPLDADTVEEADFLVDGSYPSAVAVGGATATLTVAEMATDATPLVTLTGNGVADLAGNFLTEGEVEAADKIEPEVAIVVAPDPAGVEEVTFTLSFSEAMNVIVPPTVTFNPDIGGGPFAVTGAWTTSTEWQGTAAVTDAMEGVADISVTSARDVAVSPNIMVADIDDTFTIDTLIEATFSPGEGDTIYTASPVVRISFGEVVTITAATFDGEDVLADLTTTDDMTFRLATQDLTEESHTIIVSAEDELGNTITDASAAFTVEVSQTISLSEGWNLISLPLIPDDDTIDVVLADISDSVTMVEYYYNNGPEDQGWLWYQPGVAESTLTTMEDGKGYWVNMSSPATLTITGSQMPPPPALPPTYAVAEGWNLIGFKSTAAMDNDVYLVNLGVDIGYTILWGYEPDEGYFNVHPMNEHPDVADSAIGDMEVWHGYWLWATESGIIIPTQ